MRFVKWSALAAALVVTVSLGAAPALPSAQTPAAGAPNPQLDQYKRNVGLEVDAMGENIQKMNDMVFSFGELGFQEFETSKCLTDILKQNGFTIEMGIAGIPTAWTAKWGSGKPMQLSSFGEKWDQVQFADVDGDGDLDVVANCEEWWADRLEVVPWWDPRRDPPTILRPGERIRFVPMARS